ncbi:Uncharacterised protein [Mycobacteroides abscessus subsp. abscessus]|nr:Uncharacterised protein [Mycobacteroides abscessus subsp. abscessus]
MISTTGASTGPSASGSRGRSRARLLLWPVTVGESVDAVL